MVASQQPSQVAAEQATPEQDPCRQIWSSEQVVQPWPPEPQASVSLPDLQAPFSSQHPAQASALQLQLWLSQSWLPAQVSQGMPPLPQASSLVPSTQVSFLQHPEGQVEGLQLEPSGMHWLLAQSSVCGHLMQGRPPLPQASSAVPSTQVFPTQQPSQFPGSHDVSDDEERSVSPPSPRTDVSPSSSDPQLTVETIKQVQRRKR